MLQVAVIGAAGYSGEELLRLLTRHPHCNVSVITSRQHAEKPVGEVFPRFADEKLCFSMPDIEQIKKNCDVVFLALPHGLATEFAIPLLNSGLIVIDISADFRLNSPDKYQIYYNESHPAPELLEQAVYGLPERYRAKIVEANLIACAGCYPTSIILPTSPLLESGLASAEKIVVSSMSGVSGAGRKVDLPYIFPECNESVRAYAPCGHRHLPEIEQELALAAGVAEVTMNFIPHLVPVNRGINSTIILDALPGTTLDKIGDVLNNAYGNEKFVRVLPHGKLPDTKHVTLTNVCEIGYTLDLHTGKIILVSCIDNLTKGASGQAVQNMNIRCGFDEATGLC
jgi:N-acetyl-gamma-glutamyl-phosphate reductase